MLPLGLCPTMKNGLAACNGMWTFITTIFTHPRTPRAKRGNAFRQIQTYRPVHSEVRQCWLHILTMRPRHPAYRQHHPPLDRFRAEKSRLRLLSADFTELYNLLERAVAKLSAIRSIRRAFQDVTPSFHPSEYQFSKVSGCLPFDFVPDLFSQERVARLSFP